MLDKYSNKFKVNVINVMGSRSEYIIQRITSINGYVCIKNDNVGIGRHFCVCL